jgi:hypothetical protein
MDAVSQGYMPRFQINAVHICLQTAHMLEHFPQRTDEIGQVHVARSHFVLHGREKNIFLSAEESHFNHRVGGDRLREMQGRIQAAKTAAENHDPRADRGFLD